MHVFKTLDIHGPMFTLITLDASESRNTFWFDLLSLDEAVLRDIHDAFPNLTACFSFFETVFISLFVTIYFLLLLNTISFLTICWCQLLLLPHGRSRRVSLCFDLTMHVHRELGDPGMAFPVPAAADLRSLQRRWLRFSRSDSPLPRPGTDEIPLLLLHPRKHILWPKTAALLISMSSQT